MTHALSRRIARALSRLDLTIALRLQAAEDAEPHDSFDTLPAYVQQLVRQGEGTS